MCIAATQVATTPAAASMSMPMPPTPTPTLVLALAPGRSVGGHKEASRLARSRTRRLSLCSVIARLPVCIDASTTSTAPLSPTRRLHCAVIVARRRRRGVFHGLFLHTRACTFGHASALMSQALRLSMVRHARQLPGMRREQHLTDLCRAIVAMICARRASLRRRPCTHLARMTPTRIARGRCGTTCDACGTVGGQRPAQFSTASLPMISR